MAVQAFNTDNNSSTCIHAWKCWTKLLLNCNQLLTVDKNLRISSHMSIHTTHIYNMLCGIIIINVQVNQSLFGYVSTCYKAVNTKNKSHCVLRRLHGKNNTYVDSYIHT